MFTADGSAGPGSGSAGDFLPSKGNVVSVATFAQQEESKMSLWLETWEQIGCELVTNELN